MAQYDCTHPKIEAIAITDLNDIATCVQVVRYGSFAEASRRMGVPANTLSRRVQLLEAQLGIRL